jgi:CO/xanthine dehydrogenase Mo-binding subunit
MDEMAHAAGVDPYEFRRWRLAKHPGCYERHFCR